VRGSGIGIAIGILPGLGATVASFLSYGMTQRAAKDPSRFGKGAIEGIAAAESADNAVIPSSFVPLFALGIPGNVISAILIGAFLMHGVTPGPLIFSQQPKLIYGIYAAMLFASLSLLVIGYFGQQVFARAVQVPLKYIIPIVLFLCSIGAYLQGGGVFGIGAMVGFGVLGFLFNKLGYSFVTFLIGFVIGPSFELSLRQSLALTNHNISNLSDHPIAIAFGVLTILAAIGIASQRRTMSRQQQE
jgi:putative tricarboxylic transport membrane protein